MLILLATNQLTAPSKEVDRDRLTSGLVQVSYETYEEPGMKYKEELPIGGSLAVAVSADEVL
jgi:hypothetical protein